MVLAVITSNEVSLILKDSKTNNRQTRYSNNGLIKGFIIFALLTNAK